MAGLLGDPDHPFLRPRWRRIAVVVLCVGWGLFELASGAAVWGVFFLGLGALAAWELLLSPRARDLDAARRGALNAARTDAAEPPSERADDGRAPGD